MKTYLHELRLIIPSGQKFALKRTGHLISRAGTPQLQLPTIRLTQRDTSHIIAE